MQLIEILKDDLVRAKADKERIVAPYNARIKYLESAIKSLDAYNVKTDFINARGEEYVKPLD